MLLSAQIVFPCLFGLWRRGLLPVPEVLHVRVPVSEHFCASFAGQFPPFIAPKFLGSCVSLSRAALDPPQVFYSGAGRLKSEATSSVQGIAFTTIGNLGEAIPACGSALEGGVLKLSCSEGTMSGIEVFYGTPVGQCGCPVSMQPIGSECPNRTLITASPVRLPACACLLGGF